MLDYIITDFEQGRGVNSDSTIGAMVICDSAEQAKEMFKQFQENIGNKSKDENISDLSYSEKLRRNQKVKSAALILHDVGSKEDRKEWTEQFKAGQRDILFVYNMLQTGFDAPRLKKLYLGRVVRKHNLLQALTRVNRTYKSFRYGYVVDFADIMAEFEATNRAYFEELQSELGDEFENYSNLFKPSEEIKAEITEIKDILFEFDIKNAEVFSQQINEIQDRQKIIALKKALTDARVLYNLIRMQGDYDLLNEVDFQQLNILLRETSNHLALLNLHEAVSSGTDVTNLLNSALENIVFQFTKIGEKELVLADQLKSTLQKTREALSDNFDKKDPKFLSLKDELARLFDNKKLSDVTQEEMNGNIKVLEKILKQTKTLNASNDRLRHKYAGDPKYARVHKRIMESTEIKKSEVKVFEVLEHIKGNVDEQVFNNSQVLQNDGYFEQLVMQQVISGFHSEQSIDLDDNNKLQINQMIVNEYQNEYKIGELAW
jgi:type I restriction enzyme R subunit